MKTPRISVAATDILGVSYSQTKSLMRSFAAWIMPSIYTNRLQAITKINTIPMSRKHSIPENKPIR